MSATENTPDLGTEFRQGWPTLLASSVGNGSGLSGLPFYTFGVFVVPLSAAFEWTRGQVSIAASFMIIGTAITAPIIGSIIDKYGTRRVALLSLLALAIGYLALTQLSGSIAIFYVGWLLMSLVGGGTTPVVWTRAVNMWFDRGRGLALGLCLAGSGVSGIVGPLFCTYLIATYGWQGGYMGIAVIIFLLAIPLIAAFFKERAVHGAEVTTTQTAPAPLTGLTFEESLRTVAFWKIAAGFLLVSGAVAGLLLNLVPLLIDRGMTAVDAARIAGLLGVTVVVGRVGVGFLVDTFRAPLVARILLLTTAVGCSLLTIGGAPTWVAMISVVALGLAAAAEVDLVAFLTSRYCGMKAYGKIYGLQLTIFYTGAAVGPFLVGVSYDYFHSYLQTLYVAAAILLFGGIVLGTLGPLPDFSKKQ